MWRKLGVAVLGLVLIAAAGFGEQATDSRTEPTSTTMPLGVELTLNGPRRPDDEQMSALHALTEPPGSPSIAITSPGGHGHDGSQPASASSAPALVQQLDSARQAAAVLARESRLPDAGYYLGSYYSPGIGTHYIDWRLVGATFNPARPAMLLVDTAPGHRTRLAGFSYWVRSDGPPAGFDGDGDVWHNHRGLCFVDAVMTRENVADPSDCDGDWIDGADLWMLHVWIVPGYENLDGVFAPTNPELCPARKGPDVIWC